MKSPQQAGVVPQLVLLLTWSERIIFFVIGVLLFGAAIALLIHSGIVAFAMVSSSGNEIIVVGSHFLDLILLVLMVVELAYTVMLSLGGAVLIAEPFLIVGLIAVIRRILVITVGEVGNSPSTVGRSEAQTEIELLILTAVVITFVVSIWLLRGRGKTEHLPEHSGLENPPADGGH